jgi:hypothetical protein
VFCVDMSNRCAVKFYNVVLHADKVILSTYSERSPP